MRLPNDYDERQKMTPTVVSSIVLVTLFVGAILVIVLLMNRQQNTTHNRPDKEVSASIQETVSSGSQYPDTEDLLTRNKLSPEDLDFWDKYPEDTVVLYFGDHLPHLETTFYQEIQDPERSDLERKIQLHTTPFFIWANYDIPEQKVECTSLSYLATYLLELNCRLITGS